MARTYDVYIDGALLNPIVLCISCLIGLKTVGFVLPDMPSGTTGVCALCTALGHRKRKLEYDLAAAKMEEGRLEVLLKDVRIKIQRYQALIDKEDV